MLGRILRVLVLVLGATTAMRAHAQPCPQPVTNLATTSGVCAVRITWTPSANTVTQVVRWGIAPTINLSVVLGTVGPNVNTFDHTTPGAGTNYYWVVSNPVNFVSCTAVTAGPITGSTLTVAPRPVGFTPGCTSTSVVGQTVFDATSYRFYRRQPGESLFGYVTESPLFVFTDTTGVVGAVYDYAVVPVNSNCADLEGALGVSATFGGVGSVASMPPTLVVTDGEAGSTLLQPSLVLPPGAALQWMKNGQPLVEDGRAYNVTGGNLQINPPHRASDAGVYKLRMTTSCGVRFSPEVCIVVLPRACPADFNASGTKDVQDIFDFLNAWFAPCP